MNSDPLLLHLERDLLINILDYASDLGKCAEQITSQVREIIAARIVALFERGPDGEYCLLAACPDRKKEIFDREESRRLIACTCRLEHATFIEPGKGEAGRILAELGMKESFIVPLRVGEESFGMLLLLDIMDNRGIEKILDALHEISALLSLVFKNSFLYRNMESLVEQRTKALQKSESRSRIILQTAMDGFWIVDHTGRLLDVNDAYCDMIGYSRDELLAMTIPQLEVIESAEEVAARIHRIRSGEYTCFETIHRRKDRTMLNLDICAQMLAGSEGLEIVAFLHDITERKKAEKLLRDNQFELLEAQRLAGLGSWTYDPVTQRPAWSEGMLRIWGLDPNHGAPDYIEHKKYIHPDDFPRFDDAVQKAAVQGIPYDLELRLLRPDGLEKTIRTICEPQIDPTGNVVRLRGTIQDITELKLAKAEKEKMQAQLNQSQKMEAIGVLAGGIAHDFNNILAAIMGYTEMAREDSPAGSPVANDLDKVLTAAHRAKDLVKQILAFSRQSSVARMPMKIQLLVKESLKLLRASIPSTISITEDIHPQCGTVLAEPTQIHQIIMNLCTNAYHAMETSGGELSVKVHATSILSPTAIGPKQIPPGEYVEVAVSDTGTGIGPDIIDKIFDPYFTTKGIGKGTGMGLSITHGIVKSYGGAIAVESTIGQGTTFRLYLPVIQDVGAADFQESSEAPRGKGQILFIDDEELLMEMGKDLLERLGYTVTCRRSSFEALETFMNDPHQFDLVITDQTMPGMTGIDLARRMLQVRPDIPIILCTGYSNLVSEESAKIVGIREFAFKPLTKSSIAHLVEKILKTD